MEGPADAVIIPAAPGWWIEWPEVRGEHRAYTEPVIAWMIHFGESLSDSESRPWPICKDGVEHPERDWMVYAP